MVLLWAGLAAMGSAAVEIIQLSFPHRSDFSYPGSRAVSPQSVRIRQNPDKACEIGNWFRFLNWAIGVDREDGETK